MKILNKIKNVVSDILFIEEDICVEERISRIDEKVLNTIADRSDEVLANDAEFDEQVSELLKVRKAYNSYSEITVKEDKPKKQISEGAWKFWATVVSATASGAVVIYSTLYADSGNFVNDFTRKVINKSIDGDKF